MVALFFLSLVSLFIISLAKPVKVEVQSPVVRPAQAIGVRGKLLCKGFPESGILVKLYDHDSKFKIVNKKLLRAGASLDFHFGGG